MTKAVSLLVARETQAWVEALYDNGAVTFEADGAVKVNPKVRDIISQMHDVLSAGNAEKKANLEKTFDDALVATSKLGAKMGSATLSI